MKHEAVAFRLPASIIAAVDEVLELERLSKPGRKITRTDILRETIYARFARLETVQPVANIQAQPAGHHVR